MANVIIADDDLIIRGILRSILAGVSQTVFLAKCGEEAVDLAASVQARLILLDLNMPRLNGLVTCEKLRHLPGYADTPIVVLSGYDGDRERLAATRVGATQFIAKPFQPAQLLQSLTIYLDVKTTTHESTAQATHKAWDTPASESAPRQARSRPEHGDAAHHADPKGLLDEGKAVLDICRSSQRHAAAHAPPRHRAHWE